MRYALSVIFVVLVVVLAVCAFFSFRSRKPHSKPVGIMISALIPPVIGNLFIISSNIETLSIVGCYTYFLGMNLAMGAFTYFTLEYCDFKWHKKAINIIVFSLLILDSIQLLINIGTAHAFSMELIDAYGSEYWRFVPHFGQTIHRVVDYTILAAGTIVILVKAILTTRVYREKFIVVLLAVLAVAAWQTFYIVSRTPVDISMTAFGAFGVLIFLLVLHYRPLRVLDRMLGAIASKMPDAILFFDPTGKTIWANEMTYKVFEVERNDYAAMDEKVHDLLGNYEELGFGWTKNFTTGSDDNLHSYVVERQQILDDRSKPVGSYLTIRDNTEETKTLAKETFNASHDSLTKAWNRAGFNEVLEHSDLSKVFLVLIDLDAFKQMNDEHGHNIGDRVLMKVVEILKKNFRDTDYVCRVGGDEFAVIINNADRLTPKFVEERISFVNRDLQNEADGLPSISVSAGGAFGKDAENAYELANNADHAMYQIKFSGKCGFALYESR